MTCWNRLPAVIGVDAFLDFRDGPMCCAHTYSTRRQPFCRICVTKGRNALHELIERRYRCKSPVCVSQGRVIETTQVEAIDDSYCGGEMSTTAETGAICPVIWKVDHCTAHDEYIPLVNSSSHLRGAMPCVVGVPKLTDQMKRFIATQDDWGVPPRLILVNLKANADIKEPRKGWPTPEQVGNVLKSIRRLDGSKNSVKAVRTWIHERHYHREIDHKKMFAFGTKLDSDGYAHVGSGEKSDPFHVGITSVSLIDSCLKFIGSGQFVMFHADATFKLSDLGYPVISCGFTDQARSYQVAALFVVSRRTAPDYAACFAALARVFKEVRGRAIHVDAVMGDAEEAQANAYLSIPEFARTEILMCFFHVLYNVRKKIKHLPTKERKIVFKSIMDMHFSENEADFRSIRDATLDKWRSVAVLKAFSSYFEQQWLTGRFWRWQAFHAPPGYATTNNPCEVYNASLKRFFQRKRWHMTKLLEKLTQHLDVQKLIEPKLMSEIVTPTPDILDAASLLIQGRLVKVFDTVNPACVHVSHIGSMSLPVDKSCPQKESSDSESSSSDDDEEFLEAFDVGMSSEITEDAQAGERTSDNSQASHPQIEEDELLLPFEEWKQQINEERRREKACKLYRNAVKWSFQRSHRRGMPANGWLVDVNRCICGCKYFVKFLTCAHVVVARSARSMSKPGVEGDKKLVSNMKGKTTRKKMPSSTKTVNLSTPSTTKRKRSGKDMNITPLVRAQVAPVPFRMSAATLGQDLLDRRERNEFPVIRGSAFFSTNCPPLFAPTPQNAMSGRPPLATRALSIQDLIN